MHHLPLVFLYAELETITFFIWTVSNLWPVTTAIAENCILYDLYVISILQLANSCRFSKWLCVTSYQIDPNIVKKKEKACLKK